jgi:hypothetical protein
MRTRVPLLPSAPVAVAAVTALLLAGHASLAAGQTSMVPYFGKNNVHYDKFDWRGGSLTGVNATNYTQTGTLTGKLKTSDGVPLPEATIVITSSALQGARTATSDVNGVYLLPNLPPGAYVEEDPAAAQRAAADSDTNDPDTWAHVSDVFRFRPAAICLCAWKNPASLSEFGLGERVRPSDQPGRYKRLHRQAGTARGSFPAPEPLFGAARLLGADD